MKHDNFELILMPPNSQLWEGSYSAKRHFYNMACVRIFHEVGCRKSVSSPNSGKNFARGGPDSRRGG